MIRVFRSLLAIALLAPVALAVAQLPVATDSGAYVMRLHGDTLLVERFVRRPAIVDADLEARIPVPTRLVQHFTLGPAWTVTHYVGEVYRARDTAAFQRFSLDFRGDSAEVDVAGVTAVQKKMVATKPGAIPLANNSMVALDLLLRRARLVPGDSAAVSALSISDGSTLPVVVRWRGDSAVVRLAGVELRARVAPDGSLLGAAVPAQGVTVERVASAPAGFAVVPPKDYSAPPDAPYTAQEVRVRTKTGLTLAGTLTIPKVRPARGAPAVVTITGSGTETRDEELPGVTGYRIFGQLADTLGRRGIAVLRLDDRGAGGSSIGPTGLAGPTSADFADDIRAALAYLRTRPEIDAKRLGLVGHSEGGMIAPMIAATDPRLAGIVLLAGTASTGRQILQAQQRYAADSVLHLKGAARDSALAHSARVTDSMAATTPWLRFFLAYDPAKTARRVTKVPVLILQGMADVQVPPSEAQRLANAFAAGGNEHVTVKLFPHTNHLFTPDAGVGVDYAKLPSKAVRPEVIGAIADWLVRVMR